MSLRKQLQHSFNAYRLANAGEMLSRRDKRRLLDDHLGIHTASPTYSTGTRGTIAIGGDEERLSAMLDYAYSSCQRLSADLVVLTQELTGRGIDILAGNSHRFRDAAIPLRVNQLHGDWLQSVRRFLRSHREVMFLALSDLDSHCQPLLMPQHRLRRHQLPVPLVVVDQHSARLQTVA